MDIKTITKVTVPKIIFILVAWQLVSTALMAVGVWPPVVAQINAGLLAVFILFALPYYSVLLLIMSIPFSVVLPNPYLANLPTWRVLFAWLFLVWFVRTVINQRTYLIRIMHVRKWYKESTARGLGFGTVLWDSVKRIDSRLMPWDKTALLFVILALFSLLIAKFPLHGFKQILFLINCYFIYIVLVNTVTDEAKLKQLIRYTTYSLGIILGWGFVQYLATFFTDPYYFWQYWAMLVSGLFYGQPLGEVLSYSNSWFSSGSNRSLRMFGMMPDTHSFGVLAIFLLGYLLSYINIASVATSNWWQFIKQQPGKLLAIIFLTLFAIVASGTRGIWVGMLAPLGLVALVYYYNYFRSLLKMALVSYIAVLILVILSPFINTGLNWIRTYDSDANFLDRAESIYDLSESSNVGRLEIWKTSLVFATVHPFGVGYGNFLTSIVHPIPQNTSYEQLAESKNLRYNLPQKFITAHSLYLQMLVELGFAGLLAFILFWWEYFEKLLRHLRTFGDQVNRYNLLVVSLALSVIWLLAYGFFDVTILNDRVLQYLFISLGISGLIFAKYKSFDETERVE